MHTEVELKHYSSRIDTFDNQPHI